MEQKNAKKRFKIGEKGKSWLLLSLAISFMMCIFAPLEAYFANKTEFWFELKQILPVVLVVFAITSVILCLISMLLQKIKWSHYIYGFVFCYMLYFYIQGNYVPRNYGVLNGVDIDWGSYTAYAIISIVLLLVSLAAGIFVCLKVKEKIYSAGRLVCTILILMQFVTIGTLYIQNNVLKKSNDSNMIVTRKDMFDLSENNNIVVFVLDTFDSSVMQDMLASKNGDEYKELFANFTYYPDTVGAYPTTRGAMPQLLTGEWYKNDKTYVEYVAEAYKDNEIYDTLKNNNYSIGVYTSPLYMNPEYSMYTNVGEGSYEISDNGEFAKKIFKLVAFNYMPHQLKQYFFTSTSDFEQLKTGRGEYPSFSSHVQNFYKVLTSEGLSVKDDKKSFRLYHTDGIHAPYTFDVNLNSDSKEVYDVYDVTAGNFTILKYYFDQLKENGIYDKTTIVIMADHGYTGFSQNPLFMIKNANENHELKVSDKEMSYDYLENIYVSLAKGDAVEESDMEAFRNEAGQRKFLYYSWDDSWDRDYLPNMVQYVVDGNAMNTDNMVLTKTLASSDNDFSYSLGKELSFAEDATANAYFLYGFSLNTGDYTWTNGTSSSMLFRVEDYSEDLALSMKYHVYTDKQRMMIYVNDNEIANYEAKGYEDKTFIIPKEYISEGEIELRFEFPDAVSPKSRGESTDARVLALAMKKLTISVADTEAYERIKVAEKKTYELNSELSFGKEDTANKYILGGFSVNEGKHTWTDGKEATMVLNIVGEYEDLELTMEYFTYAGSQQVIVSANGKVVSDYVANGEEKKNIIIPAEYVENRELLLTFDLPDAISPQERGESTDIRVLALGMRSLKISSIDADDYEIEEVPRQEKELSKTEIFDKEQSYEVGTELSFMAEDTARKYIVRGFSDNEGNLTWTDGNKVEMIFYVSEGKSALELTMDYFTYTDSQQVIVSVNGKKLEDYVANGTETKRIIIPAEYITEGELLLTLDLPDAVSPESLGKSTDKRNLALAMKTLKISAVNE